MAKMYTITRRGSRLDQLTALAQLLARELDITDDAELIAKLSKQYRDTIKEIDQIKGLSDSDDEINEILSKRKADGKSGAVR